MSMFRFETRSVLRALAVMLTAAVLSGGAWAQSKVVFQVSDNDPAKWNLTLNNVRNVQADLGADKVDVEVVVYGPGIGMLTMDSPVSQRVAEALGKNVKVVACQNTMKAKKLAATDMLPSIGYVPAGVVELIQRQSEGYAYIKP
jgi:intracellular sulfur oxidation DsrE/DsrF family protein